MIAIIDYGAGNLKSIQKALEFVGEETVILEEGKNADLDKYAGLVLPGVGAFPGAMKRLKENNFVDFIEKFVVTGRPFLGVCLGMQLLFEWGFEDQKTAGLSLLKGNVIKMETDYKIPHMGWNQLEIIKNDPLFNGLPENPHFYFVHSYQLAEVTDEVLATVGYGTTVPAVIKKDNVIAFQFHPEKSGDNGIKLLENFRELL
ncbi:MAG: glutamine amidotransferase [Halanaerobium sp. 4-GBenrich]|jgi:glutamine amidotransferase|uniref:Imidazole glycerol phosphate synthase subunit HisH n=1 Tax=Halanaerobium congolense TaxID=54121 RepID=A0A1M7PFR7_9FIRM|nr:MULTISPECIES: imidazole glycerol phosphate synthase subunit HisH [Halanaerobium]KXS49453.1 MAG: glutamine amidotransferase [Halanaerobium sp. T82-1]ODS49807.1 MAG: glutamine amidotransferase [Halanaerobium sp. 4-GBenrich]OEG63753.1 MAG: imidazole glycerol phosphate synthase, glutamine amidotransferase subunit [Halanaerobium sp. MDAL1]PTX16126.1 glutamine amidotransferase [Halanaerobium congolense]PUU95078.1 MAG: Imidazole glycerol phosphate synthase subunit HisH [Halanaerobium sp.]